ncbi:Uncharacterized protein Rs2_04218 [Raphanus sativus]|nr:Uncharacterized protein Rs2_04218 [Raphanus sativus]
MRNLKSILTASSSITASSSFPEASFSSSRFIHFVELRHFILFVNQLRSVFIVVTQSRASSSPRLFVLSSAPVSVESSRAGSKPPRFFLRQSPQLQVGVLLHAIHRGTSGISLLSSTAWPCSPSPPESSSDPGASVIKLQKKLADQPWPDLSFLHIWPSYFLHSRSDPNLL